MTRMLDIATLLGLALIVLLVTTTASASQPAACLASDPNDWPATITSMKDPTSQATPMFGSTLVIGVNRAPARPASPPEISAVRMTTPVTGMPAKAAALMFSPTARIS